MSIFSVLLDGVIRNFLLKQKLGYVATVSVDGTPNLSPKGTIFVWDDSHLIFANIRSPQTMKNLQSNPKLEINVIDPVLRRGYRFKGTGKILKQNDLYEKIILFYKNLGIKSDILGLVLVSVVHVSVIVSPLYDLGFSEQQIRKIWTKRLCD